MLVYFQLITLFLPAMLFLCEQKKFGKKCRIAFRFDQRIPSFDVQILGDYCLFGVGMGFGSHGVPNWIMTKKNILISYFVFEQNKTH